MITKTAIINLRTGLDLRAAGIMCQKATAYKSHIELRTGDIAVNAKSVLSVMSVGFMRGTEVTVECSGSDEAAAAEEIAAWLESEA